MLTKLENKFFVKDCVTFKFIPFVLDLSTENRNLVSLTGESRSAQDFSLVGQSRSLPDLSLLKKSLEISTPVKFPFNSTAVNTPDRNITFSKYVKKEENVQCTV